MNYAGSDLDLHLYDSQGSHVGLNYETGEVELQIPGASYNGPNVSREWIVVSNLTGSQSFTAKVVGVEVNGKEGFSLSYMIITKSIEITPVTSVVCPGRSTSYEISITNFNEGEEVHVLGLRGLEQEWYSFDRQTVRVKPGETARVRLEVTVPSDASLESYAFTIYASNIIGEAPASLEVARPEDVRTSVLSLLNALKDYVDALPQEAFSKEQTSAEIKKASFNNIHAVIKMVEEGAYNDAINKLRKSCKHLNPECAVYCENCGILLEYAFVKGNAHFSPMSTGSGKLKSPSNPRAVKGMVKYEITPEGKLKLERASKLGYSAL